MSRMAEQQLYINGGYTSATSGRTFETINPATGEVLATVQAAGREDVDRAVESAQRGQNLGGDDRHGTLAHPASRRRPSAPAQRRAGATGDPGYWETLSETAAVDIVTGADVLEYYAGLIPALEGSQIRCATVPSSTPVANRWGGSRDRRVELPDPDRPVEIGASAGRWQCDDFQTERSHPADRPQAGGNLQRSGPAGRGV